MNEFSPDTDNTPDTGLDATVVVEAVLTALVGSSVKIVGAGEAALTDDLRFVLGALTRGGFFFSGVGDTPAGLGWIGVFDVWLISCTGGLRTELALRIIIINYLFSCRINVGLGFSSKMLFSV